MLLETQLQEVVIYVSSVFFLFVSPILNIIYLPKIAQEVNLRWNIRIVGILIYITMLLLLFWSLFIIYN
jgi:hypothetical protein